MKDLLLSEIVSNNRYLGDKLADEKKYEITILSNITLNPLKDILEYYLRYNGLNAHVNYGNYDNIVQNSVTCKQSDLVVVFWEPANFTDGFHYKVNTLDGDETRQIVEKIKSDIDRVFSSLRETSLVLFNSFSSAVFDSFRIDEAPFDILCRDLNEYISKTAPRNVKIVDINKVLLVNSVVKSADFRHYNLSKTLYTPDFLKSYTEFIGPIIFASNGRSKKALIFDCDNTLWKGIVGEDGFDGIQCSEKTKDGAVFQEVQYIALELNKKGVILGLCSKNNPDDVMDILKNHPDMVLKEQNFSVMKLNWDNKVSSLQQIAEELNIGLDSIVYVDDSDFEINYIRQNLPDVVTVQVPSKLSGYPGVMRRIIPLFFNISGSAEDLNKTEIYRQQFRRKDEIKNFESVEDYLKSLDLKVRFFINDKTQIPRIAQLTQKTNQFNLTTKRYTEGDIEKFMDDDGHLVLSFSVQDRFGDYGLTGLFIICRDENNSGSASIDTFLMSCRIIGRNIERSAYDYLIRHLQHQNVQTLSGRYLKTHKNIQVEELYDSLGSRLVNESENEKTYLLKINEYDYQNIDYIHIVQEEV